MIGHGSRALENRSVLWKRFFTSIDRPTRHPYPDFFSKPQNDPQNARSAFISNPNARHRSLTEVLLWQLVPLPFEATIIGQTWPDTRRLFWGDCAGFRGASGQPHIPLR